VIVTSLRFSIDQFLAAALRGEDVAWPSDWRGSKQAERISERIAYHGIAGLITERAPNLRDWPDAVLAPVRQQAIALAMWELRHKVVLGKLFAAFTNAKVDGLLLKGTALAYDLYPAPATRARGDSDLLVERTDLATARRIFVQLGYRRQPLDGGTADDLALQEVWSISCDAGTTHHIDLHWHLLNAPALRSVLDFGDCAADPLLLPLLAPGALAMNRVMTLLHTCIHRAMHLTSPYFVDGVTYYGGDRLIWAKDIDLLARALSDEEWRCFSAAALDQRVASVCLDGLGTAQRLLGTNFPSSVRETLGSARNELPSAYLLDFGQARRAWQDLLAIRGWNRKIAYLAARALPSEEFMRRKYLQLERSPLALLHVRRMIDLIRPRLRSKA